MAKPSDGIGSRELQEGLGIVGYEWDMLRFAARKADELSKGHEQSAFLECFLIHARGLWEFFYRDVPVAADRQDALAVRYFPSGLWQRIRPKEDSLPRWRKLPEGVGREIAHLSWRRLQTRGGKTSWDLRGVLEEIKTVMSLFHDSLDKENARLNATRVDVRGELPTLRSSNFTTSGHD